MSSKGFLIISIFSFVTVSFGQFTKRVLFLGNSYTAVNNLPQTVANVAASTGDNLIFDSNTPGGYTFQGHSTNATSLSKIALGTWDFVVLQEQSQMPSFPTGQVQSSVFPYAKTLDSLINAANPCTETMFYMTWGRKNGDASNCSVWPPVCTYQGMDSLLYLRYMMMTDSNHAVVSPVGRVWKSLRNNYPLLDLYQSDGSHPSLAGTYAAACCFYTCIFRKDPMFITDNGGLGINDAANIRQIVKSVVYDSLLNWRIGTYDPFASFNYQLNGSSVIFNNSSQNASQFVWDFGDGSTDTTSSPTHNYVSQGTYTVSLQASTCGKTDTFSMVVSNSTTGINSNNFKDDFKSYPNPAKDFLVLKTESKNIFRVEGKDINSKFFNLSFQKIEEGYQINIKELESGVYFFNIFSDEGVKKIKIIKQ
ncbi:MAG: PKD domain-containing protein [Bacteroidota bacterium]|jgi:hypothetical protein